MKLTEHSHRSGDPAKGCCYGRNAGQHAVVYLGPATRVFATSAIHASGPIHNHGRVKLESVLVELLEWFRKSDRANNVITGAEETDLCTGLPSKRQSLYSIRRWTWRPNRGMGGSHSIWG